MDVRQRPGETGSEQPINVCPEAFAAWLRLAAPTSTHYPRASNTDICPEMCGLDGV
jgi:hypothetical protein